ncbi:unnamed protein product [Rhizoctonia solani]|nr:unnamed protein product [Rhizoctonia solani]
MSSKQGTLDIGSGNEECGDPGTPFFLVVEYNGRKVAIGRNPNYQETITSIKKNVHECGTTPHEQVTLLAFLKEVGDHVQITEEVWAKLLPRLLTIRVKLDNATHRFPTSSSAWNEVRPTSVFASPPPRIWTPSGHAQTTGNGHGPARNVYEEPERQRHSIFGARTLPSAAPVISPSLMESARQAVSILSQWQEEATNTTSTAFSNPSNPFLGPLFNPPSRYSTMFNAGPRATGMPTQDGRMDLDSPEGRRS